MKMFAQSLGSLQSTRLLNTIYGISNAIVAVISYTVRVFTMCSKKCGLLMYMV